MPWRKLQWGKEKAVRLCAQGEEEASLVAALHTCLSQLLMGLHGHLSFLLFVTPDVKFSRGSVRKFLR